MNLSAGPQLKSLLAAWRGRWLGLQPRERVLLAGLGLFLAAFLFETFFYRPLRVQYDASATRYAKLSGDYQWLRGKATTVKSLQAGQGASILSLPPDERRGALEKSLSELGAKFELKVSDEEEGSQLAQARWRDVGGKPLMQWVAARIEEGYLLRSLSLKIVQQGRVAAKVSFEL